jgi:hypothetical protein
MGEARPRHALACAVLPDPASGAVASRTGAPHAVCGGRLSEATW